MANCIVIIITIINIITNIVESFCKWNLNRGWIDVSLIWRDSIVFSALFEAIRSVLGIDVQVVSISRRNATSCDQCWSWRRSRRRRFEPNPVEAATMSDPKSSSRPICPARRTRKIGRRRLPFLPNQQAKKRRSDCSITRRLRRKKSLQYSKERMCREGGFSAKQLIRDAVQQNDFLRQLDHKQVIEMVECMYEKVVKAGDWVIREGEAGSHLYVAAGNIRTCNGSLNIHSHS